MTDHIWTKVEIGKIASLDTKLDQHLAKMSEDGWELVSVVLNDFDKFSYMFFWKKERE